MEYAQYFFTLFCMVSFCLGLNQIMSEGNLLYFLRKPFEGLHELIEDKELMLKSLKGLKCSGGIITVMKLENEITGLKLKYYLAKPLVLCITCFASIWGGSVFIALNGLNENLIPYLIISCVSTAFINTAIYVKINI